jgi:hypothetical protein
MNEIKDSIMSELIIMKVLSKPRAKAIRSCFFIQSVKYVQKIVTELGCDLHLM